MCCTVPSYKIGETQSNKKIMKNMALVEKAGFLKSQHSTVLVILLEKHAHVLVHLDMCMDMRQEQVAG